MASGDDFVKQIAFYVQKWAPQYGILVHSPIIAQAILESAWGKSTLASKYHNYFGLTCGVGWTGPSVNMQTWEEYTPGTKTNISQNFRVYDSMDSGTKGYFVFISSYSRYSNLKGVTDPKTYTELIKKDGYATASNYVSAVMTLIAQNDLTKYDGETVEEPAPRGKYSFTVEEVRQGDTGKSVALMQKCLRGLGYKGQNGRLVTIDAQAGVQTIFALKKFQKAAGLQQDGICAEKSWKILLDV